MKIVKFGRKPKHKIVPRRGILGIAAINGVSSKDRRVAEIFQAAATVGTISIDAANPGDADARAERQLRSSSLDDIPDNLVSWDEWTLPLRQLSLQQYADRCGTRRRREPEEAHDLPPAVAWQSLRSEEVVSRS